MSDTMSIPGHVSGIAGKKEVGVIHYDFHKAGFGAT